MHQGSWRMTPSQCAQAESALYWLLWIDGCWCCTAIGTPGAMVDKWMRARVPRPSSGLPPDQLSVLTLPRALIGPTLIREIIRGFLPVISVFDRQGYPDNFRSPG